MNAGRWRQSAPETIYRWCTRLYPAGFRQEYGDEMLRGFSDWRRASGGGPAAAWRFWVAVLLDLARSLPAEWRSEWERRRSAGAAAGAHRPSYGAAVVAGTAVFLLYTLTLAPTAAFWDAGEYIAVAHLLGIPHPPGSPLFVMIARTWELLLTPLGLPVAVRINLFSAAMSATAHALWFLVAERALCGWTRERSVRLVGAACAVAVSASAFTVWNHSNVNEKVYAVSLLSTALVSWLALRWRDTGKPPKQLLLCVFVVVLTSTSHLMGALVVPALVLFVLLVDRSALVRPRFAVAAIAVIALALSVLLFLPIRAAHQPVIAEGSPQCETVSGIMASVYTWGGAGCEALSSVLTREQYGKPSIRSDPNDPSRPRSAELVAAQFANYGQYFNWQWSRSVGGRDPLLGGPRLAVSLSFLLLGLLGFHAQWRGDRAGAVYLGALFVTLSAGLVIYLNFRFGYSIAWDRYPVNEMHEVRERDYFFLIGFSVWGLWAGMGVAVLWARLTASLRGGLRWPRLAAAPVLALALVPLALNWSWASRSDDYTARDWAYNLLMSVEPYGVLFTNGDNDTFPLWYLQEVEGLRKDVTVVVLSYLRTPWYMKQLRDLTTPCPPGVDPATDPTRIVCQRPFDPADFPAPLVEAGWARDVDPPRDSIAPITDEEIERMAGEYSVTREPMILRVGAIEGRLEPGTPLLPSDLFVAAILRATLGDRPVHLMPGAPVATTLGIHGHTVRQGLVWKLRNSAVPASEIDGLTELPREAVPSMAGAAIDLPLTDTLVWEVYRRRGRVMNPRAPWVDAATANIPGQYMVAHYVAAEAHALRSDGPAAERHLARAYWWRALVEG